MFALLVVSELVKGKSAKSLNVAAAEVAARKEKTVARSFILIIIIRCVI